MADRIWRVEFEPFGLLHLTFEEYDELKKMVAVDDVAALKKAKEYMAREQQEKADG